MSHTLQGLRRQIQRAGELQSVVRTMKALAASSIGQYERSVAALGDYRSTVTLGLGAALRERALEAALAKGSAPASPPASARAGPIGALVFGSDQGLVGQFNDRVADHALATLAPLGGAPRVWAVGERVHARLTDAGQPVEDRFAVPVSVQGIAPLVGQVAVAVEASGVSSLFLFYHRPDEVGYHTVAEPVLPLDAAWERTMVERPWPTPRRPQVLGAGVTTLRALIRAYLFVSIYRACAESLASENASRLVAMQRADKNIDELLATLNQDFHRLRHRAIDEELFDVVASYEGLS